MEGRHQKVQVVMAARDPDFGFSFLILKTNKKRGQFWQNITGSVEDGETLEEAALREAMEETGLEVENIVEFQDLGLKEQFTDRFKRQVDEFTFLILTEATWKPTIDPKEHEDWRWLPMADITPETTEWPSNADALLKASKLLQRMDA